jgi:ABC-2 type transport system ATP-binding protein
VALLGPNGAGKTTTVEMLEGLLAPDEGTVEILGLSWKRDARAIRQRIGVQLQQSELPEKLRVSEALRLFRGLYQRGREQEEMLALVGLEEKRRAFVGELSGGQRQRLSLACALVHEPEVLFLDEPTTGLDPQGRRQLWEIVETFKQKGGTVLLTTHFMEEAERLADRIVIIDHGRELTSGTPREVVASLHSENIFSLDIVGEDGLAPPEERLERLAAQIGGLPDVRSVRRDDGLLRVGIERFEQVLPEVLRQCAALELRVADLGVHRPTLEDVFVSLTGRGLRE